MAQFCQNCSRANPPEAVYCFHDGFALNSHVPAGGPVAVGAQRFLSPFVFPAGRRCGSFDELALACQEDWVGARDLLRDGYLESFLAGVGRVDLARAAKEAAGFPDADRGLDQLLAVLPTKVLAEPKLRVDPAVVNLGLLDTDHERTFELELENQGARLLYGRVSASEPWLALGDAPGASEKLFHFTHESRVAVRVLPGRVRAGGAPAVATLLVRSNAGETVVKVRAEKPVRPFPSGALAGAESPRQIAERAQANPHEVAPLFESGEVARWYASNGWVYPVKIPAASGVACVQQFFEALGVTKAPKVEISHKSFQLFGEPGEELVFTLVVSTQDKRLVFAHATTDTEWLRVGRPRATSKTVTFDVTVTVPEAIGESVVGSLLVVSNGKARWRVPVAVAVGGSLVSGDSFNFPPLERPHNSKMVRTPKLREPGGCLGVLLLSALSVALLSYLIWPRVW